MFEGSVKKTMYFMGGGSKIKDMDAYMNAGYDNDQSNKLQTILFNGAVVCGGNIGLTDISVINRTVTMHDLAITPACSAVPTPLLAASSSNSSGGTYGRGGGAGGASASGSGGGSGSGSGSGSGASSGGGAYSSDIPERLTRVEESIKHLATKEDLNEFRIKWENTLPQLATKEDLNEFRIEWENTLPHLATKEALNELKASLLQWFMGTMISCFAFFAFFIRYLS